MPPLGSHSSDELSRFIEAAGESANIDAKGPMEWDGGEASAGLTKDILALSNRRDGGVIVVGKDEPDAGKFVFTGVSDPQATSFDTTKVATWVNNHCSPPVHVVCYRVEYQGRPFIVIAVAEFDDIPVICTKSFELPGKPPKVLLRKGTIYVRTANAASEPLSSIEDLRALIGMATTKRGDQMLAMFQTMLKGQPLLSTAPVEDPYKRELEEVREGLESGREDALKTGAWSLMFHPVNHRPDRWEEIEDLNKLVEKTAVRIRPDFPPDRYGVHAREWRICNSRKDEAFGLTRSGLFLYVKPFTENVAPYKNPRQGGPDLPPGGWIEFQTSMFLLIEFFMFMSRIADVLEAGEELSYEIVAAPLTGRRLVTTSVYIGLDPSEPCQSRQYRRKKSLPIEVLRASWEEECTKAMHGFFELFNGPRITVETLQKWIEKFKQRDFGR